jgi:hypothetical protein
MFLRATQGFGAPNFAGKKYFVGKIPALPLARVAAQAQWRTAAMRRRANATGLAPRHGGRKGVGAHLTAKLTADRHKGSDYDL